MRHLLRRAAPRTRPASSASVRTCLKSRRCTPVGAGVHSLAERLETRLALAADFLVNTTITADLQSEVAVAADAEGDFVIAWQSGPPGGFDIYARRYNAAGLARGDPFRVNTFSANSQIRPAVAMDADGDFVVAWDSNLQDGSSYGVYAQRYDAAGQAQGAEFRVNTSTSP
jgi:hypothetical protein